MLSFEGLLVEHGDLLSGCQQAQEVLLDGFEPELTTPNTLLNYRNAKALVTPRPKV
jgi:hypothetical protein